MSLNQSIAERGPHVPVKSRKQIKEFPLAQSVPTHVNQLKHLEETEDGFEGIKGPCAREN